MTLSEVLLWDELKQNKILGYDFDRQRPIDNFIVDFYCKDLMLAIEIDGESHNHEDAHKADVKRQKILEGFGVMFLRFDDLEVKRNITNVLRTIQYWIEDKTIRQEPTPNPSREENLYALKKSNSPLGGVGVGKIELLDLLEVAKETAVKASKTILKIYDSGDFSIEAKADNSPLTKADKAAHDAIVEELEATGIPILSEEGRDIPYEERKNWEYFWMIDPLDGTKEFIKKNGEFTVNIALIHRSKPILGVVQVPVTSKLYFAIVGQGAFLVEGGIEKQVHANIRKSTDAGLKVVASRSHLNEETQEFLDQLKKPAIVSMGSSLKLLAIAEGTADVYPRFAPTMEWDIAAAQIIVEESGAEVTIKNTSQSVRYNKEELLNPHFLVSGKNFDQ